MTFKMRRTSLILGVAAAGMMSACGGGDAGSGTVAVSLTDAPACGYDQVNVTVNKIRIHRSATAGEGEGGWTDIAVSPARKINLLDLTNGITTELGQATLPAGQYTQMRLVLDRNTGNSFANSVVRSGSAGEIPLDTPSGTQSGIKLVNGFEVVANQRLNLVLDFDACKSVVEKGNGGLALKPVIKIVPPALNGIEGYVDNALLSSNVMVTAQQNGEIVSATVPDAQGRFYLSRLVPGEYDVVFTADDRATAVVSKVPVATTTSTLRLSTSAAPIALQAAAAPYGLSGTVTLNPAITTEDAAYVSAKQTFAAGPTVTVKYRGANVTDGAYSLAKLPNVAPQLWQYSATQPVTFAAGQTSLGDGRYTAEASATGYQKQSAVVDVATGNATRNYTLTK